MKFSGSLSRALILIWIALSGVVFANAAPAQPEAAAIESLIQHVGSLKGAEFIRNGKSYDAATAATFLRRKFNARSREIRTAREFVDRIATASGTSGQPYLIRFPDRREVKCGEYLHGRLGGEKIPGTGK